MDAFLAAVVFGISLLTPVLDNDSGTRPLTLQGALYAAVICASLTLRRRCPSAVLAVTASGTAAAFAVTGHKSPLMLATMIAMCTCALHLPRRKAVLEVAATAVLLAGTSVVFDHRGWTGPEVVALSALSASAAAVGFAVRNRRAYVAAVEERARRAEQTREEEARRRVVDERLRIARDLHDVLAHHIALINVQAAVVDLVLETEPVQARESLAHIRRAARSSLEGVRTTLGLLRQPDAPDEAAYEPSPGLADLADLIASFTAAGLIVDQKITGTPVDLPPAVGLTAYRVVQEALTNASRHASRPNAELELDYLPSALRIAVRNPAGPVPRSQSTGPDPLALGEGGHGLLGMRERASALGGTFTTQLTEGRFEIRVLLPHEGTGT
ncbi:histidine kinase OS=Streptomyces aurantiogriseus OX=66870 GN=GCM10010251_01500 PE=4 SV=1 [Streptomyces aurantiogriseus]|uniref:histidine kinase n=1 Tax=Streptomyces aurantiogriseus TaxID=66870 RepID=A0A918EZN2_9ACTN|nr:histidine kinase [Streptomyces aurantiogriseus]GGQ90953.1 two-component sensor histidine kinase [Streptomyces aurantiogriseus]